ncbi:hypothetical protein JTE90_006833 [Oedothorax gibbosus]|uniref:WW domain-containing protein n=1 Tax=Oedothorax gibbosus TaxID=931172 RepID=A0AAV6TVC7_9ARAC|nr:hypothetical protein JTE90_006833 [Oedothorax gibbosus]
MAAVHPQPPQEALPAGWECRYDPRTGRHYFLNHLEHITTWEDPRLRPSTIGQAYAPYYGSGTYSFTVTSPPPPPTPPPPITSTPPLSSIRYIEEEGSGGGYYTPRIYTQGGYIPNYGSPKTPYRFKQENSVQVDERILMKLCVQFPTVEEGHIWQLLKQYHNRENVVVSALLAEGQPRAQTHSVELTPKLQKSEFLNFQTDEALFHKLKNFFPAADSEHIRNLLRIYNNQEHEVIGALVAGNRGYNSRHQSPHPSSPKMKLRYLKLVYPECDEAFLFEVLNNCDNNAQEASGRLETMGYLKRDTPITRPQSREPIRKPSLEVPRPPPTPERPHIVIPPSASDKLQLVSRLQDQFPAISRTLVNMALDSSCYNEDRAKQFLSAMTPQDGNRPLVPLPELGGGVATDSSSPLHSALPGGDSPTPKPPPRSRHASASQDGESRHSSPARQSWKGDSSREATPSKSPSRFATTGSPARHISTTTTSTTTTTSDHTSRPKFKKEVLKVSKATSTRNDFENLSAYRTRAKGPDPTLRKGPSENLLLKEYLPWRGPDPKNCKGPNTSLCRGPDPNNLGSKTESRAKGPQRDLHKGPLSFFKHSKKIAPEEPEENEANNCRSS